MTGTQENRIVSAILESQTQTREDLAALRAEIHSGFQRIGERIGSLESAPARRLTESDITNIQNGERVLAAGRWAAGRWATGPKRVGALLALGGTGGALVIARRVSEWFF